MAAAVYVFDAYGTLFDVGAAARRAAEEPGGAGLAEAWEGLAATWRDKQLQYTWLRAAYGAHTDFWQVTTDALDWALAAHGLSDEEAIRARLLQLYWELEAYPDAAAVLTGLKAKGAKTAILSNGAPDMLRAAVSSAGIGPMLDAVLSAEQVGVFKPHRAVYGLVGHHFGTPAGEVAFVSANGWDAACATGHGFRTVWVNRRGEPADRLPWQPERTLPDLAGLPELVFP